MSIVSVDLSRDHLSGAYSIQKMGREDSAKFYRFQFLLIDPY